jgi:hypothetical protein
MGAMGYVLRIVEAYGVFLEITLSVEPLAASALVKSRCVLGGSGHSIGRTLHILVHIISIIDEAVISLIIHTEYLYLINILS